MNHWGKIIGAIGGYLLGGPAGAIIGVALGVIADKYLHKNKPPSFAHVSPQVLARMRQEFFTATFSVMGYIFKSSGKSDEAGYSYAGKVMDRMGLPEERWEEALLLYKQGKKPEFSLHDMVGKFYIACRDQPELLEMFVEILLFAALAEGEIRPIERKIILNICYQLDFSKADYDRLAHIIKADYLQRIRDSKRNRYTNSPNSKDALEGAYALLNTTPEASDEEVKRAYRRLTSRHHPDKLISKGLPDEMLKLAEIKTREIRAAYERIREVRRI